jgi:hypothetical protein
VIALLARQLYRQIFELLELMAPRLKFWKRAEQSSED